MELVALLIVFVMLLVFIFVLMRSEIQILKSRRFVAPYASALLTVVAVYTLLHLFGLHNGLEYFRAAMKNQLRLFAGAGNYGQRLANNGLFFALYAGVPLFCLAGCHFLAGFGGYLSGRGQRGLGALTVATAFGFLFLLLSGITGGGAAMAWSFLMPPVAVIAAGHLWERFGEDFSYTVTVAIVLFFQTFIFNLYLSYPL